MNYGHAIRTARTQAKLTQAELAERCGLSSASTIGNYENGTREPTLDMIVKICDATGISWLMFSELLQGSSDSKSGLQMSEKARGHNAAARLDLDLLDVPLYTVEASIGAGRTTTEPVDLVQRLTVRLSQLRRHCTFSSVSNLAFITGRGNSMEPTYREGDVLLIDQGVREHVQDGVYVLNLNGEEYVKTLHRWPDDTLHMISDAMPQRAYAIRTEDVLAIRGRVLLAWNARRL